MNGLGEGHSEQAGRPPEARTPVSEEGEVGLAQQAWTLLFELLHTHMRNFPALAAEFDLSPVQAHVLRQLGEGALAMSTLATYLSCDASNVTGLVDRLEARKLVERRSSEQDRRVKMLVLTEAGAELRGRLMARMASPPPFIAAMPEEDLAALGDIMRRALKTQ
ncbi:MarR family transcriptional regulator [Corallococcus sp. ZKHCc1 1396]|uniref:MarR family transcriptional regulator n=1 Tax=Corallococcus soli TaxID=2710757 RepID=A0ABR9PRY7_9BACT|nr:MarR family transcriptional regulator [Corallococcus soli]MBE4750681.1 MarR family transcriptional regulator [Corallococcus soli]